jgi:AcrR family transcriptional regulator
MEQIGKQERSKKRIEIILNTAEEILLEKGLDAITIANISKYSGLKRTSTYKFFPTSDALKSVMITRYIESCSMEFKTKSVNIKTDQSSVIILRTVEILFNFFKNSKAAQIIILSNTLTPSMPSKSIHELSSQVQTFVDMNIDLPEMFNKDGVFRVLTQIIISVFSLNTKESGELNEVGKIEANRAAHAYLLNWINQSS